jgi:hypothetical protein
VVSSILNGENNFKTEQKNKEVAVLTYADGANQLLQDVLLGKILDKRKNDLYWLEISHITLIPPEVKHPLFFHRSHYERTIDITSNL